MELRVLKYFLRVAREENITKAAQLLHISQPTLSRQLMQLEEELGVQLFKRSKHNVYLTSEGMLFRRRAQEIINLSELAKEEMKQSEEVINGEISIGAGELLSVNELGLLTTEFKKRYPLVKFHVFSGNNSEIKLQIDQGLLDMGLLIEPVDIRNFDFIRMETKENWGVLTPVDSPLAEKTYVTPQDLIGIPLISVKDDLVANEMTMWAGDYARHMTINGTYVLLYNAVIMARQRGETVLCLGLEAKYEGMTFIPLKPAIHPNTILVWKENQSFSTTVERFIKFIKEFKM